MRGRKRPIVPQSSYPEFYLLLQGFSWVSDGYNSISNLDSSILKSCIKQIVIDAEFYHIHA